MSDTGKAPDLLLAASARSPHAYERTRCARRNHDRVRAAGLFDAAQRDGGPIDSATGFAGGKPLAIKSGLTRREPPSELSLRRTAHGGGG